MKKLEKGLIYAQLFATGLRGEELNLAFCSAAKATMRTARKTGQRFKAVLKKA